MWATSDHRLSISLLYVVPCMSLAFSWWSSPSCLQTGREAREHLPRPPRALCGHIPASGHTAGGGDAVGLPYPMLSRKQGRAPLCPQTGRTPPPRLPPDSALFSIKNASTRLSDFMFGSSSFLLGLINLHSPMMRTSGTGEGQAAPVWVSMTPQAWELELGTLG